MPAFNGLSANNISFAIGGKPILHDVSVSVQKGCILGVLGPNGAGKTSLLKVISGQVNSKGSVSWLDKSILNMSVQDVARHIAVVNQLNDSVFSLSLKDIVRMGLLPHLSLLSPTKKRDRLRVEQAIEAVGLSDRLYQNFNSLSGGEQQRGLIARALVQQSPLLVLDEPVNHLDVYYQHQILQLLKALAENLGLTVVMSLHDLNLAALYCDNLCLLNKGQLVASGAPIDVFDEALLTHVFNMHCRVSQTKETGKLHVDFCPSETSLFSFQQWKRQ